VDVVEPWRACCDRQTRYVYERNHRRTGSIQNDLTRKENYKSKTVDDLTIALVTYKNLTWRRTDINFEEKKKQHIKKWLKILTHRWKIWSRNRKNKLRRRRNVVEKYQSESRKFDAIDVGLYWQLLHDFNHSPFRINAVSTRTRSTTAKKTSCLTDYWSNFRIATVDRFTLRPSLGPLRISP